MKRLFICLIMIFCLTGCTLNEDFNKVCSFEVKTFHLSDYTTIDVVYDSDDLVKEATVTKNYKALDDDGVSTLLNIKEANSSYNKKYGGKNIKVFISKDSDDEYEIKYKLDVQKIDDDTLEEFKLKKNSIKFFNRMKKENIECEVK